MESDQVKSGNRLNRTAQTMVFEHLFVVKNEMQPDGKIPKADVPKPHPTDKTGFVFHNRFDIDQKMKEFEAADEEKHGSLFG